MDTNVNNNAIQFITIKEDGALEISIEAIEFLSSLKNQQIAIVSINGKSQQHKTCTINKVFNDNVSFNTNTSTEGIWLWGTPITLDNGVKVIVMDTQGLDKNNSYSQKIFKLSILISTCFIYITQTAIDAEAIEFLSYFTEDANKIKINETYSDNHLEQLSDYFPHFIWITPYINDKDADIYLDEHLTTNMKKVFLRRNCLMLLPNDNDNDYGHITTFIKKTIKAKKIDNFNIDGNSLFGIVQNYIDIINDEEQPPEIYKAMENVLLSKGKNISEVCFDNFKINVNNALSNKLPTNIETIYKTYNDLLDKETITFCDNVTGTLTVKQSGEYIIKLYSRTRDELASIIETNKEAIDEWLDMIYKEIKLTFDLRNVTSLDDMKQFFISYYNDLYIYLNKFVDIPYVDDNNKNIICVLVKIVSDFIKDKMNVFMETLTDNYNTIVKHNNEHKETLTLDIKKLNEQLIEVNGSNDKKNAMISELNKTNMELESKYEKLMRDMKAKEKEYQNNINIEVQKYQKNEMYYQNQVKEKENIITSLESKISKLTKELTEASKTSANKISELNKENLKLNVEIERLKGEKRHTSSSLDTQSMNLQSIFKNIQTTLVEFKESVDKLDRDNENVFKKTYLETSAKDIEYKSREWINEIRTFREEQIRIMNENYEKIITKARDEIEELNFELTKKNFALNEQIEQNKTNNERIEDINKKIIELTEISESKDKIIKTKNDTIQLLETKLNDYTRIREDLEIQLNNSIVKFKMLEDEIENIFILFDSVMTRKKDKFEKDVTKLSQENQNKIMKLAKVHKFIK